MAEARESEWLWCADRSHFVIHEMGEVSYVYSARSGNTHVFNLVSLAILEFFCEEPRTVSALVDAFPALMGLAREECPTGVIRRMFKELDEAGLVCPVEARS